MSESTNQELMEIPVEMMGELSATQTEMLLGDDRPKIDYSKPVFSYNATRLWRDRPDVATACVKLLAEPRQVMPYRRIMARCHVSYHVLRQLEISCGDKIKDEKKNLGDVMLTVTEAYAQRALETVDTSKGKEAVLAAAIAGDKYLQFRGEATVKIDMNMKIDVNAKIDAAHKKILDAFENMKRATVVEPEPDKIESGKQESRKIELLPEGTPA